MDALIDRRPPTHLGQYVTWIQQVAQLQGHAPFDQHRQGFDSAVKLCCKLDDDYRQLLRLPAAPCNDPCVGEVPGDINVINVFDCLCQEMDVLHSPVLMFVEGPWRVKNLDIEEPQAAVVLVAAHVHGLRGAYRQGVDYSVGADAYLRRASIENRCNDRFKGQLIKQLEAVFDTPEKLDQLHGAATQYLSELHGVSEEQLGCLMCSPFVNQARGLEHFLHNYYPEKKHLIHEFRQVLRDKNTLSQVDVTWLESISGLPLASLQALYHIQEIDFRDCDSLISLLWAHDPGNKPGHTVPAD